MSVHPKTQHSLIAAIPAASPPPNVGFTRLPSVILQKILAFANTVTLAATSKDFKEATEALIKIDWCHFNLNLLPNIQKALASQNLSAFRNPTSCRDLQTIYNGLQQQYTLEGNTFLAIRARDLLKGSFNPSNLQKLEDAAKQAESNRNLELIWPRIVKALAALNLRLDMNSAQIKDWLNANSNQLAPIQNLELSSLNLTMIPEEFSSLNLPNLRYLGLDSNRLTTLPANFGRNWNQLRSLSLTNNQISILPANFGINWNQFERLSLINNKISAFPDNFGNTWDQLENLSLMDNKISDFPDNFGSNWNRLESLHLMNNQLSVLPANFGINWNQLRNLYLNNNQISALSANFGINWNQLENLHLENNQINALPANFGINWNQLESLYLNNNQIRTLPDNFGINWNQLQDLYLNNNQIEALPANFGINWNQLQRLYLRRNQISALSDTFGAHWAWWNQRKNTSLAENPILAPASIAPPPARAAPPIPAIVQPTPPSIASHIPPASPYQKLQKTLTSRATVHVLSTIALTAIASYAIGWKIAGTLGAIYLTHRFIKGYL